VTESSPPRLLITAGPTHEAIDAVRYLANRSSGRLGIALADEAHARGWRVTLLLGPTHLEPTGAGVATVRFGSTAELEQALVEHLTGCDALIMAAAVADFRPREPASAQAKIKRSGKSLMIELEPTPDLLARASRGKRPEQVFVGFALEPTESMLESALDKLDRKGLDMIVANPLETMDAADIEATILSREAPRDPVETERLPPMTKPEFASELIDRIARRL